MHPIGSKHSLLHVVPIYTRTSLFNRLHRVIPIDEIN